MVLFFYLGQNKNLQIATGNIICLNIHVFSSAFAKKLKAFPSIQNMIVSAKVAFGKHRSFLIVSHGCWRGTIIVLKIPNGTTYNHSRLPSL